MEVKGEGTVQHNSRPPSYTEFDEVSSMLVLVSLVSLTHGKGATDLQLENDSGSGGVIIWRFCSRTNRSVLLADR